MKADSRMTFSVMAGVLLALAVFFAWPASKTFACSPARPYEPVDDATLIVAGRVTDWSIDESLPVPLSYTLVVDDVLKGAAASPGDTLRVKDGGISYDGRSSPDGWVGSNSLCGTFSADPTGVYLVVSLTPTTYAGHDYESTWLTRFYIGDGPGDPLHRRAVADIEARLATPPPPPPPLPPAPAPPDAGTGEAAPDDESWWPHVIVGLALAACLGALQGSWPTRR